MPEEITRDAFLGGRLIACQPARGFRSGVDAVFLAASVPACAGDRVLELGCGAGVASLCLGRRVEGLDLTGVEVQSDYAALARRNASEAGIAFSVIEADVADLPEDLRAQSFDHVLTNPPYFREDAGTRAQDRGRERALREQLDLRQWIHCALRRLRPGGVLSLVQRTERLPQVLGALGEGRIGAIEVLPLAARQGRAPRLFLLRGVKSRKTDFRLCAPLVLHQGAVHAADQDSYTPEINAVLRHGAPMPGFRG